MALDDAAGKVFVGRGKEINDILGRLKQNNSTRTLLVGESRVGKSALLDEIYRQLTAKEEGIEDQENKAFVGYYDKSSSLEAPSQSSIEPFNIVLASHNEQNPKGHYWICKGRRGKDGRSNNPGCCKKGWSRRDVQSCKRFLEPLQDRKR